MSEEILQQAEQAEEESTYTKQTWVDHFVDEQGFVVQQGTAMDALPFSCRLQGHRAVLLWR